jgi:hypothetical protein
MHSRRPPGAWLRAPGAWLAATALLSVLLALPRVAGADDPPSACAAWDVEYALAANVVLSDTTMGAGDGVHAIGPGRVLLRIEAQGGQLAGHVRMLVYEMKDYFRIVAKALFWGTKVTNDTHTVATPDATGTIASGTFTGRTLKWDTDLNGMHSDGTVTCEGSLCGKFGAPPEGQSEVHTPPHPVTFNPFEFDADKKTFTMALAVVSRFESPRQTSRIALAGREVKRTCISPGAIPSGPPGK